MTHPYNPLVDLCAFLGGLGTAVGLAIWEVRRLQRNFVLGRKSRQHCIEAVPHE